MLIKACGAQAWHNDNEVSLQLKCSSTMQGTLLERIEQKSRLFRG